jgi:arginyl-tRNA synthetase
MWDIFEQPSSGFFVSYFEKLGYHVDAYQSSGRLGNTVWKLIVAYKKWGSKEAVEMNGIPELLKIYVKFHEEAERMIL